MALSNFSNHFKTVGLASFTNNIAIRMEQVVRAVFKLKLCVAGIVSISVNAGSISAFAQDTNVEATSRTLEEVIVTARRKEENAQTVPVSIAAFSQEELTMRTVLSMEDLTRVTPGMRFAVEGGGQNTTVSMRGLSKVPIGDGTPAVVIYFADVPLPSDGTNIPIFDLASIQVLKGPQGTLFGRNTIGGAILISPQAPTYDYQGYIKAGIGDYDSRALEGAVNLPLVEDKLALRLAGQVRKRDGYQENIGPGDDFDDLDQYSLRGSVLWEPTSSFSNTLIVDYFEGKEAPPSIVFTEYRPGVLTNFAGALGVPLFGPFENALAESFAAQQARGPSKINSDVTNLTLDRTLWGISNTTNIELGNNLRLRNIFGYRSTEGDAMADVDAGPLLEAGDDAFPLYGGIDRLVLLNAGQITNKEQISDEIQLLGSSLDDRVEWIIGGFYLKDEPGGPQGSWFNQFEPYSSTTGVSLRPPAGSTSQVTTESYSVFGQAGIDLSDWLLDGLKLNLGYRYTWDDVSACGASIPGGTSSLNAPLLTLSECKKEGKANLASGAGALDTDDSAPTWTVGLDYQISEEMLAYITSRRGYRAGGINTPVFNTKGTSTDGPGAVDITAYQYVGSDEVTDVEIGLKSDLSIGDMPARVNVSAYSMEYTDAIQFINVLCCIDPTDPGLPTRGSFALNAADLTIQGVEFEGTIAPTSDLTLSTTVAYVDQEVDDIAGIPEPFTLSPDEVTLPTPEWSATLAFRWQLPVQLFDGELAISGDYFWTDEWQGQGVYIDSYEVAGFRLNWASARNNLDASLFVTNVFDEEYAMSPAALLAALPFATAIYGHPRMYGFELTYRFGE